MPRVRGNVPPEGIGPWWATWRRKSPSTRRITESKASQRRDFTSSTWARLPKRPKLAAAVPQDSQEVISAAHRRTPTHGLAELFWRAVVMRIHVVSDKHGTDIKRA